MEYSVKVASVTDIPSVKSIADAERRSLAFVTTGRIAEAVDEGRCWITLDGNRVVTGFVIFRHRKRDTLTTISLLAVDKQHRRQGCGRLLIEAAIATGVGRTAIQLKAPKSAWMFYLRLGFIKVANENPAKFILPLDK